MTDGLISTPHQHQAAQLADQLQIILSQGLALHARTDIHQNLHQHMYEQQRLAVHVTWVCATRLICQLCHYHKALHVSSLWGTAVADLTS